MRYQQTQTHSFDDKYGYIEVDRGGKLAVGSIPGLCCQGNPESSHRESNLLCGVVMCHHTTSRHERGKSGWGC